MSKVKVSNSELRMIIFLCAAVILALAYFFGFNNFSKAAAELETQNDADRITVNNLEAMVGRKDAVEKETAQLRQDIQDIIAKYPSDLTTEKAICIVKDMEDYSGVEALTIAFGMHNLVMAFQPGADASAEPPAGYYAAVTVNYRATYDGYKRMIEFVEGLEDRTTAPIVSATYDEELDLITGVITMNMYTLEGTGKEYVAPPLDGASEKGVESLFGGGEGIISLPAAPAEEE